MSELCHGQKISMQGLTKTSSLGFKQTKVNAQTLIIFISLNVGGLFCITFN